MKQKKRGKPLTWPQPIWPKSKPAQHPVPQSSPTYPFGRLQPQAGKQLGGAPADTRSAAVTSTSWMKTPPSEIYKEVCHRQD
jgi:hypothetical protein